MSEGVIVYHNGSYLGSIKYRGDDCEAERKNCVQIMVTKLQTWRAEPSSYISFFERWICSRREAKA